MSRLNTFDDDSVRKIADAVRRDLANQGRTLEQRLKQVARDGQTENIRIRTGFTTTNEDYPTYPTDGCRFVVKWQDWGWPEEVDGTCPGKSPKRSWKKTVVARTYDEEWIPEDTEVLIVRVPGHHDHRWYIIPIAKSGLICFKLLTDRTRETDAGGLKFGRADAIIQDIDGDVPDMVGDTVEIRFWDKLWLGAVKDCEGLARPSSIGGTPNKYIAIECQELSQWIQFLLTADRIGTADADIAMSVTEWNGNSNAVIDPSTFLGQSPTVHFAAGTFPRAFQGAIGFAILDVDYENDSDNSGMKYHVLQCDQMSPLHQVTHGSFCSLGTPTITAADPMFFYPFGQRDPNLTQAQDYIGLASNGGEGFTGWHETAEEHAMLNAQYETQTIVVKDDNGSVIYFDDQQGCAYKAAELEVQLHTCKQAQDATQVQLYEQEVASGFTDETSDSGSSDRDVCQIDTIKICTPRSQPPAGDPLMEFVAVANMVDLEEHATASCLNGIYQKQYVACVENYTEPIPVICGDNCDADSSGSGSTGADICGTCADCPEGETKYYKADGSCECFGPGSPTEGWTACPEEQGGVCVGMCLMQLLGGSWETRSDQCVGENCNCPTPGAQGFNEGDTIWWSCVDTP